MKHNIVLLELTNPCESLVERLAQCGYRTYQCRAASDFFRYLPPVSFEYLVVNVNLPHPWLLKQINSLLLENPFPVVMFAKSSDASLTELAIRCGVSALVVAGALVMESFEVNRIRHVMDVAMARFMETQRLKGELRNLSVQLAERNSIDKAKRILMQRRAVDETAALSLIRKMALDRKQSPAKVARDIIDVDELPL